MRWRFSLGHGMRSAGRIGFGRRCGGPAADHLGMCLQSLGRFGGSRHRPRGQAQWPKRHQMLVVLLPYLRTQLEYIDLKWKDKQMENWQTVPHLLMAWLFSTRNTVFDAKSACQVVAAMPKPLRYGLRFVSRPICISKHATCPEQIPQWITIVIVVF